MVGMWHLGDLDALREFIEHGPPANGGG